MNRRVYCHIAQKTLRFLLSVFVLSLAVFCLSRLAPGDPLTAYYGERTEKMTVEEKELARERLGLNGSMPTQYIRWLTRIVQGDLGYSLQHKQPVAEVISERIGNTLLLGGLGFVLTFILSMLLGIYCALHEGKWQDRLLCKGGTILSCIPDFWLSVLLIFIFSVQLGILPASGAYDLGQRGHFLSHLRHLILPLTAVVLQHLWYYAYLLRNCLLQELSQDYVLLGRAKGLPYRRIVTRHCLRACLPAYLSLTASSAAHILSGTYIVEAVFSYPGLGTLCYESARLHDYDLLMALCLLTGLVVIVCGQLAQFFTERFDPRTKEDAP